MALVAPPPIDPPRVMELPEQIVNVGPAFTMASGFTVIVNVLEGPGQLTEGLPLV